MASSGSSSASYQPGYNATKHHEWRTAENSAAYLLPTLERLAAAKPGLAVLDVGAGSGTITRDLARRVPAGRVTATDVSAAVLERARGFAEAAGVRNLDFLPADAYRLPFPDGSFDVVHCSQVLCHLERPADALREMMRVAAPGSGVVAACESDMEMQCFWPDLPGVALFQHVTKSLMRSAGSSCTGGRQLVSWALAAGARRDQVTASFGTWCYSAPADRRVWGEAMAERMRIGETGKKAVELGLIEESQIEEIALAWEEWLQMDDASSGFMNGEILIHV